MTIRIYLGDEYSLFKNGVVICNDGSEVELQNYIHRGMMVDSILLGTGNEMAYGEFLLRWQIYPSSLKIYDISPDVEKIIWVNESNKPIRIDKLVTIAPGETFIFQLNDN